MNPFVVVNKLAQGKKSCAAADEIAVVAMERKTENLQYFTATIDMKR